jgi:hypothetical protein
MDEFNLYQPHVFDYLKYGQRISPGNEVPAKTWFREVISDAFNQIAGGYGCEVNLSGRRLDEARELWIADVERAKIENSIDADHFKQAGFLSYWLRRRVVVAINHEIEGADAGTLQRDFLKYGNEICSFLTCFRLALFFEIERLHGTVRLEQLNGIHLAPALVKDVAVLLHHKNVSPHAMYLVYRALFYPLRMPPPEDDAKVREFSPQLVR